MVNWVESPPLISPMNEYEGAIERLKSLQSWSILKNKRSDFIFVTRKRLINWSSLSKLTCVSQMTRHIFCTKVSRYLPTYCNNIYLFSIYS